MQRHVTELIFQPSGSHIGEGGSASPAGGARPDHTSLPLTESHPSGGNSRRRDNIFGLRTTARVGSRRRGPPCDVNQLGNS